MDKKDILTLFPYFKNSKRINIFLREKTKFFPHYKDLSKKSTEELIYIMNALQEKINSLNLCMEKHSKNILSSEAPSVIKKEIINFIIESEMKRLCAEKIIQIKIILKNQRKITKYVKGD
ncbi:MAG: hypothetical protein WC356_00925 [Candidatus Micrarchaeia archaeon]|jgi:hypothetical protein